MTQKPLFCIENLNRVFGSKKVLDIPYLEIPRGKLISVLGESGSGKTTLLEILGMMNSFPVGNIIFHPDEEKGIKFSFRNLWENESEIAEVRLKFLSFIFQDTILLPDFTIAQNVALASILQGIPHDESEKSALTQLENVKIDKHYENFQSVLSGGQKQRAAFARAVNSDFKVLFADEPTGNLDEDNADLVFGMIQEFIQQNIGHSAIIVTHDIDLAIKYSDEIIIIPPNGSTFSPRTHKIHREEKDKWQKKIIKELINTAHTNESKNEVEKDISKTEVEHKNSKIDSQSISPKHVQKYFKIEQKKDMAISWRNLNLLTLTSIFAIAILSIAFAKTSLNFLEVKMKDPFVRWLSVEVPYSFQKTIPLVVDSLRAPTALKEFKIEHIKEYKKFWLQIWDNERRGPNTLVGRTIDVGNPLLERFKTSDTFLKRGKVFESETELGVIVTESFFEKYGYEKNGFLLLHYEILGQNNTKQEYKVPLPILGIVNELPEKLDFLATYYVYEKFISEKSDFRPEETKNLLIFTELKTEEETFSLKKEITDILNENYEEQLYPEFHIAEKYEHSFKNGWVLKFNFDPMDGEITAKLLDEVFAKVCENLKDEKGQNFVRLYEKPDNSNIETQKSDMLSLFIAEESLREARKIKSYLAKIRRENTSLELDISKIESFENYSSVTKQTTTLAFAIMLISVFSICGFISYMFYLQLYKIRTFLGLLKAFGASNLTLKKIYLGRAIKFLINSFFIAFSSSFLLFVAIATVWFYTVDNSLTVAELLSSYFNLYLLLFIVLVLVIAWGSLQLTAKNILKHSPGDLIYDRL